MLRFAVVTDIHYGIDRGSKMGTRAPALIDRFIRAANKDRVDFAVDLGDRVVYTDADRDRCNLLKLKNHFNALAMPKYSVNGNHDISNLSAAENAAILGLPAGSYSRDIHGYHFLFWSPRVRITRDECLSVVPDDLQWLKNTLAATDRKCVLFNHVPLDNLPADDDSALAFDQRAFLSYYPQASEVRKILEESGKVVLSMSGHRHYSRHRAINGIHYVTQQSLVEQHPDKGKPYAAYALVTIGKDRVRIKGRGLDQPDYNLQIA